MISRLLFCPTLRLLNVSSLSRYNLWAIKKLLILIISCRLQKCLNVYPLSQDMVQFLALDHQSPLHLLFSQVRRRAKLCKAGIACISWLWNSRKLPLVNFWVQMFMEHSLSVDDNVWHWSIKHTPPPKFTTDYKFPNALSIDIFKMFNISGLPAATCFSCWVWAWVSTWLAGLLLHISRLRSFMIW